MDGGSWRDFVIHDTFACFMFTVHITIATVLRLTIIYVGARPGSQRYYALTVWRVEVGGHESEGWYVDRLRVWWTDGVV